MSKLPSKTSIVKNVTVYATYLIIVWAFYRFLFQLPDEVEELIVKPIIWLIPLFFLLKKEGFEISSLGFTFKNLFSSIYLSLGLGAIFVFEGVLTNFLKYGGFNFGANIGSAPLLVSFGLSFATAFSEETSFRGYVFSRLWLVTKNEWMANLITTLLWTAIHVPIAFFIWKLSLSAGIIYLILTAIFGMGSSFIFARTKNIWGSIFLHVLWEWPIILFR
ncbi:MAG TPA: type II CAAX endopeptidase family protein [Patescibacteria group bacterium]|nr:type II CAAX endopeptidase family protein [Patescibacteria group bacterium]